LVLFFLSAADNERLRKSEKAKIAVKRGRDDILSSPLSILKVKAGYQKWGELRNSVRLAMRDWGSG
jgi:hypothetical protein